MLQRLNLFRTVQNNESFKTFPWNRFSALRIFLDDIGWWLTLLSLAFVWSGLRQGAFTRALSQEGQKERKKGRRAWEWNYYYYLGQMKERKKKSGGDETQLVILLSVLFWRLWLYDRLLSFVPLRTAIHLLLCRRQVKQNRHVDCGNKVIPRCSSTSISTHSSVVACNPKRKQTAASQQRWTGDSGRKRFTGGQGFPRRRKTRSDKYFMHVF